MTPSAANGFREIAVGNDREDLWEENGADGWRKALESYESVIDAQGSERLPGRDRWYRTEFPAAIAAREPQHITDEELIRLTEWKMARGVWRARNLVLVKGNDAELVRETSREALAAIPDATRPISLLSRLAGVGPATASAVASAAAPEIYPFFDELVAQQIPDLGPVKFTLGYYRKYAEALRCRARALGGDWSPTLVERALWANSGGKASARV